MQYALIKSDGTDPAGLGRVHNVIVADAEFIEHIAPEWDHIEALDTLHEQGLGVGIGWGFDLAAGEFIAPPPAAGGSAAPGRRLPDAPALTRWPRAGAAGHHDPGANPVSGDAARVGCLERHRGRHQ